jgi:FkbM family methyltransferase
MSKVTDFLWRRIHEVTGATGRNKNQAFRDLYQKLCVQLRPDWILEIGAHEALFSKQMSQLLPEAKVLAFEANPFVYERFKGQVPESVAYLNQAVGADTTSKTLFIPRIIPKRDGEINFLRTNPISSLKSRAAEGVSYEQVACECTTVDSLLEKANRLSTSALWIDVEGAAGDVLLGANQSLSTVVSTLFVEVETESAWSGQWLAADVQNYLETRGFVSLARDCETTWQYNEIFIRRELVSDDVLNMVGDYMVGLLNSRPAPSSGA